MNLAIATSLPSSPATSWQRNDRWISYQRSEFQHIAYRSAM
jgi:hypothetical protein